MKAIYNGESDLLGGDDGRRRAAICKGGQQRVENAAYSWKHDGSTRRATICKRWGWGTPFRGTSSSVARVLNKRKKAQRENQVRRSLPLIRLSVIGAFRENQSSYSGNFPSLEIICSVRLTD
ncbi:hypothetical protein R6Q59_024203 [Mikania micrantha]